MIEIIFCSIYGASIIGSFVGFVAQSGHSNVARTLGKENYMFTGFIVSLIPIINTMLTAGTIYELYTKPKKR